MLSLEFYKRFLNYKFILIYQLDAFVFNDELAFWCNKDYDYIGAPWSDISSRSIFKELRSKLPLRYKYYYIRKLSNINKFVGNGGFSLRKVVSRLLLLAKYAKNANSWLPSLEDTFWSFYVSCHESSFRIPNSLIAANFSIETYPCNFIKLNNYKLPVILNYLNYIKEKYNNLEEEYSNLLKENNKLKKICCANNTKLNQLYFSRDYKLGQYLLKPFRWIKNILHSLQK